MKVFQDFKAAMFTQERYEQVKFELGAVALASLVLFVAEKFGPGKIPGSNCVVAGLSSLAVNHLVDAIALASFGNTYRNSLIIAGATIGASTSLATSVSLHIFNKMAGGVTKFSVQQLSSINLLVFTGTFNNFRKRQLSSN